MQMVQAGNRQGVNGWVDLQLQLQMLMLIETVGKLEWRVNADQWKYIKTLEWKWK